MHLAPGVKMMILRVKVEKLVIQNQLQPMQVRFMRYRADIEDFLQLSRRVAGFTFLMSQFFPAIYHSFHTLTAAVGWKRATVFCNSLLNFVLESPGLNSAAS